MEEKEEIGIESEPCAAPKKSTFAEDAFDMVQIFLHAIIIIALIFIFLFRIAGVHGDSMNPTLNSNDWLVLSSSENHVQRGEIVVISQPNMLNEPLIKRVIAFGGETVDITADGKVSVNGTVLDEPYIKEPNRTWGNIQFPHKIPEGYVFVMGDNRNESSDSRFDYIGDIDQRYLVGSAKTRLFPLGKFKIVYNDIEYGIDK